LLEAIVAWKPVLGATIQTINVITDWVVEYKVTDRIINFERVVCWL